MRFFTQAEFIRMFSVFPNGTFDFFLGSGASVQAGIPTGYSMAWAFKRDIYCTETGVNPGAMKDLQSEYAQSALQAYFDAQQDTPTKGDPLEYAYYFQRCHPTKLPAAVSIAFHHRKRYFIFCERLFGSILPLRKNNVKRILSNTNSFCFLWQNGSSGFSLFMA